MDTVTSNGAYLVWIGLPISRDADQTLRFDVINSIVQTEAAKREGRVSYLDTYFFFAGEDGGYAQYIEDSDREAREDASRRRRPLRAPRRRPHRREGARAPRGALRLHVVARRSLGSGQLNGHRRAERERSRPGDDGRLEGELDPGRLRRPRDHPRPLPLERDPRAGRSRRSTAPSPSPSSSRRRACPRRICSRTFAASGFPAWSLTMIV